MRWLKLLAIIWMLAYSAPAAAQIQFVSGDYFPAAMEFKEIRAVKAEKEISDAAGLKRLPDGPVLLEAGLKRYAERAYALDVPGSLSIEILSFGEPSEAYSVLSFTRAAAKPGPPGNYFKSLPGAWFFSAGSCLVRIRFTAAEDFVRKVAVSVANRIGPHSSALPTLAGHLPEGADTATIRYFLGPRARMANGASIAGGTPNMPPEVLWLQADFIDPAHRGTITLLSFPTSQLADEYYNSRELYQAAPKAGGLYARQSGPLIGILEGNFEPESADKILGSIKFAYSVKWIYDKSKNQARMVWGVPVRILGTVVRSIVFTALLCLASIVLGIIMAFSRLYLRKRLGRTDDDAYIRLKLDEN